MKNEEILNNMYALGEYTVNLYAVRETEIGEWKLSFHVLKSGLCIYSNDNLIEFLFKWGKIVREHYIRKFERLRHEMFLDEVGSFKITKEELNEIVNEVVPRHIIKMIRNFVLVKYFNDVYKSVFIKELKKMGKARTDLYEKYNVEDTLSRYNKCTELIHKLTTILYESKNCRLIHGSTVHDFEIKEMVIRKFLED
jgi:hypothetical protein